jgi:hypothetical protein
MDTQNKQNSGEYTHTHTHTHTHITKCLLEQLFNFSDKDSREKN